MAAPPPLACGRWQPDLLVPSYYGGQCVQGSDPGGDWYTFKGIAGTPRHSAQLEPQTSRPRRTPLLTTCTCGHVGAVLHLAYFLQIAGATALSGAQRAAARDLIAHNAAAVWHNASVVPPTPTRDVCTHRDHERHVEAGPGLRPTARHRKFNWEWHWQRPAPPPPPPPPGTPPPSPPPPPPPPPAGEFVLTRGHAVLCSPEPRTRRTHW